jgi:hypothetical protein
MPVFLLRLRPGVIFYPVLCLTKLIDAEFGILFDPLRRSAMGETSGLSRRVGGNQNGCVAFCMRRCVAPNFYLRCFK